MLLFYVFIRMITASIAVCAAMFALGVLACAIALAVAIAVPVGLVVGITRAYQTLRGGA